MAVRTTGREKFANVSRELLAVATTASLRPLEGNDSDFGRLVNRGVEFHVVEKTTEVLARPEDGQAWDFFAPALPQDYWRNSNTPRRSSLREMAVAPLR